MHDINDVRLNYILLNLVFLRLSIAVENLGRCKLQGIDQIQTELIQGGGKTLCSEIYIHSVWNNEKLPQQKGLYYCTYLYEGHLKG
jgi:hypothetical protein